MLLSPGFFKEAGALKRLMALTSVLLVIAFFVSKTNPAWAITPVGSLIENTAQVTYTANGASGLSINSNTSQITITVSGRTDCTLELLRYDTNSAEPSVIIQQTEYDNGSGFSTITPPTLPNSSISVTDQPVPLVISSEFTHNQTVFFRVTDADRNLDPNTLDTIEIDLTVAAVSDGETLRLSETSINSGIFTGYISLSTQSAISNNGTLNMVSNALISTSYQDSTDSSDLATSSVLVDPYGEVFDSATGAMLDGFTIRLVNAATGQDAVVYGDDGVSIYDSTIISGGTASDSSGTTYDFPSGNYRFPFITPGDYYLEVTHPAGSNYRVPSSKSDAQLAGLPLDHLSINVGSRGETFTLTAGPLLHIDIPADPLTSPLYIRRTASKDEVSQGDFIQFRISVENTSAVDMVSGILTDTLPQGFAYKNGSARIDEARLADPQISSDGRTLTFSLGTLSAGTTRNVSYVVSVGAARTGIANSHSIANANSGAVISNTSTISTQVKDAFMRSRNILVGRVVVHDENGLPTDKGVAGVRIYMENGTYTITDEKGRYHFEGITPGTHVVQLDLDTLPERYQMVPIEENTRSAGRSWSRFIDLQGGTLWRTDFHAAVKSMIKGNQDKGEKPITDEGIERIKYDETWLSTAAPGIEWLSPTDDELPSIPSVTVAIKHGKDHKVELYLNNKPVPQVNYDGTARNRAGTSLSRWSGVDLVEGDNVFEAVILNNAGIEKQRLTRKVHFSAPPVHAVLVKEQSVLKADGITPPVITVRLTDKHGYPARLGNSGEYQIKAPYMPARENDKFKASLLPGSPQQRLEYTIREDGLVSIRLEPTSSAGEAIITLPLMNGDQTIKARLVVPARDLIIVGFAEGTAGYNTLSGKKEDLTGNEAKEDIYTDGKTAFFARGRIKGKWLLTMAYDSAKEDLRQDKNLFQTIDPGTYYTVYGDSSSQQYDAASRKKLYLKLESDEFYFLFGDYNTDINDTRLSQYKRSLTGIKSEYYKGTYDVVVFISESNLAFVRDEYRGKGITGPYQLSRGNIIMNSEQVIIETRDRFRSEKILKKQEMTRHTGYDIDYQKGTITFREPVFQNDTGLNHNFIVVKYESYDEDDLSYTSGGRIKKALNENITVGITHINEGRTGGEARLSGGDIALHIGENTLVRAEVARTSVSDNTNDNSGEAVSVEVEHRADKWDTKLYYNQTETNFGLGQTNGAESGTRKTGADVAYRPVNNLNITGSAYQNENIETDAIRNVIEGKGGLKVGQNNFTLGAKAVTDELANGTNQRSNLISAGVSRSMLDNRLNVGLEREQSIDSNESTDFPAVTRLSADYLVTEKTSFFAQQEWTNGSERDTRLTKLGLKTRPWENGELFTGIKRSMDSTADTTSADIALNHKWVINDLWSMDFGMEKSKTLSSTPVAPFNTNVPFSYGSSNDYTAGSVGATYNPGNWIWNGRIETRNADTDESWSVATSAQTDPDRETGLLSSLQISDSRSSAGSHSTNSDLRIDLAYRPLKSPWIVLNKLELINEINTGGDFDYRNWRIINSINTNYHAVKRWQLGLQYGIKYVQETIDRVEYNGITNLYGVEARYDITRKWDIGIQASALHSIENGQINYSAGPSIGHSFMDNVWVSLGYNVVGFYDRDFADGRSRSEGFYIKFRIKFDQKTAKQAKKWLKKQVNRNNETY